MGARRKGRELAMQALYQTDVHGDAVAPATLRLFFEHCEGSAEAKRFAVTLVDGVRDQRAQIDALIAEVSEHWRFERLSRVDLNVLRVATHELMTRSAPTSVVLNEAIEIARRFGTEESAVFVHALLDQIAARLGVREDATRRSARDDG
jgi:N utilization substance protein B